ncbi:RF-1 domain-containing protein [Mycena amicta]|nr:RF-1 domain-containing protein [Mycena amicta]
MLLRLRLVLFNIGTRQAHTGTIPIPPQLPSLVSVQENASARAWIAQFRAAQIPKTAVSLSFSRSSGPGGQNVNKVNTKVTLRCPINEAWIPLWAKVVLQRSPHYVASSQSIQITSTVHRSQSQNIEDCLTKFHALILTASSAELKTGTSEEQKKHVADLVKAANARRRIDKMHRSNVKATRKPPK